MNKYEQEDLENLSVEELCKKYGSSESAIKKAMYRNGYRKHKAIKIISPYKEAIYVADKQKCAEELRVSRRTIDRSLKGEKVKILEELNIKIMYVEDDR